MKQMSVPNHLAIIVDGNRRWARKHNMPAFMGHKHGFARAEEVVDLAVKSGISYISLFVFSTENFSRDAKEVDCLMVLFRENFLRIAAKMARNNVKVIFSGRKSNLAPAVITAMDYLSAATQDGTQATVNICLNYGGKAEIVDACKSIATAVHNNTLQIQDINEETAARFFYNDLPSVDFLIRTSGEIRISNFMLWQLAYAEMYFTDVLFPDFDEECFDEALRVYQCRSRRFGGDSSKVRKVYNKVL